MSDVDDIIDAEAPDKVGYAKPPKSAQFAKGKSGNRKGRPKGVKNTGLPYETLFGRMVTMKDQGITRRVTAEQAFLAKMRQLAMTKGGAIARILSEEVEKMQHISGANRSTMIFHPQSIVAGTSDIAMRPLNIITKLDRFRPSTRMVIEPWIIEVALARFGDKRLTRAEQVVVVDAVRTPQKVKWPDWWEVRPWEKKLGKKPR